MAFVVVSSWVRKGAAAVSAALAAPVVLVAVLGLAATGCSSFEAQHVKSSVWQPTTIGKPEKVGIGYFEVPAELGRTFADTLSFALRRSGHAVLETRQTMGLLERAELPRDRVLTPQELLQLSGRFPGRVYLQGRLRAVTTPRLLEDEQQVMVLAAVHDMRTGAKVGEIIVLGHDLRQLTGSETLEISQRVVERLALILEGQEKAQ